MRLLMNSLSPDLEMSRIGEFQTTTVVNLNDIKEHSITITYRSDKISNVNSRAFETLGRIKKLEDNWDEDGSPAPIKPVINYVQAILLLMTAIGQEIYNIAPGPLGEIMIDFRSDRKSFEVIIYRNKMVYVMFPEDDKPVQKEFSIELLYSQLLTWLNG